MSDPRLAATVRYHLLSTMGICDQADCSCRLARRRSDGVIHCPLCKSAVPALQIAARGADLVASCTAGCASEGVQALADGDDTPLLALYGHSLSAEHAYLLLSDYLKTGMRAAFPAEQEVSDGEEAEGAEAAAADLAGAR
jgi:hypothetical protein